MATIAIVLTTPDEIPGPQLAEAARRAGEVLGATSFEVLSASPAPEQGAAAAPAPPAPPVAIAVVEPTTWSSPP